jgi:hypothetical protein
MTDYACNKCRKTFSVNSNMRRHWRNCTETPRDCSIPSSPSVPIKQEAPSSPSTSETPEPHFADSPPMAGPSGSLNPASEFTSRSQSATPTTMPSSSSSSEVTPPKMAVQPPSLRRRFAVVSQPEIVDPVPPVQPRMTQAQEEEMRGWFLKDIWRDILERLKSWRICETFGFRTSAASASACPPSAATGKLVDKGPRSNGGRSAILGSIKDSHRTSEPNGSVCYRVQVQMVCQMCP